MIMSLHRCCSRDLEIATSGGSAAPKIHTSDKFFIAGWKLLADYKLINLERIACFVEICGLELNFIVGELIAVVA